MSDLKNQAEAVGHIPSGLFIITSFDGEQKTGYLASWVQQVSFNPMLVAFTIKPERPGYGHIVSGKPFAINIVGDHEANYLKHFWSGFNPEKSSFDEIAHEVSEKGSVILTQAKSSIECVFSSKGTPGDHEVIFAEVINSYHHNAEAKPKVHIRKSGLDY
jgi:flavin reductase (DIM6/NTAB) family NADH-FMN oxidoreductase RutF